MTNNHISLSQKNHYKIKMIPIVSKKARGEPETLTGVYMNSGVYMCAPGPGDARAFDFLLPAFESGIRCSRKGGPPAIWIISLYLLIQVNFVVIIVEFLVTVLSITYSRNTILV